MPTEKFRSKARVIDLLGRQQIADAPTAMGELFKNALDAGARNAWVDFLQEEQILTVRDDGLGMREIDVLNKWLVLATDSKQPKASADTDKNWLKFADSEQKLWLKSPSYGEKGIGRLSVATLGRITLLWTVWGSGAERTGTLCLVYWTLFRHPGKLFEDIPIPVIKLKNTPGEKDIEKLFNEVKESKEVLSMLKDSEWDASLRNQLKDDLAIEVSLLTKRSVFQWEAGTTFCILSPSDQIEDLFLKAKQDMDPSEDLPPDRLKAYHAFSTFWDPFHKHNTREFKIHPRLSGDIFKRTNRFWAPEDFKKSDHHIKISINESGFASGFIKNFNQEKIKYECQLGSLPKGHQSPGAFVVEIGYVQGNHSSSFLSADDHKEINSRLIHAGGFSIYINKVRVQPYGAIDNDFAGFEQRRLKNAGRYYFSTLRMFGGAFFESKSTTTLEEKAGREGFVVNAAMRGLRQWLEFLFVDIADSYLGRKAPREDKQQRKDQKDQEKARERLEKEKLEYIDKIRYARGWLRDFEPKIKNAVLRSRQLLASEKNSLGFYLKDCESAVQILRDMAVELRGLPSDPPVGVVVDDDTERAVSAYLAQRENAILNLNKEIANQTKELQSYQARFQSLEKRERLIGARIAETDSFIKEGISAILSPAIEKAKTLGDELNVKAESVTRSLSEKRESMLEGITPKEISQDNSGVLAQKLEISIQAQLETFHNECVPALTRLANEVIHLTDDTSGIILLSEQARELQSLKERQAFLAEMAQVGLILETADHEHEKQVETIKFALKALRKKSNGDMLALVDSISDSFEIIDSRIRLFDPLIRRSSTAKSDLSGAEIESFLKTRFPLEFSPKGFVETTPSFQSIKWTDIKRPILLGAIHNVFYNALYWAGKGTGKKAIRFSSSGGKLVISNSGPRIAPRDMEKIFTPGFSRRPNGRGLGLYIAREALLGIGFQITVPSEAELGALDGANFIISPK